MLQSPPPPYIYYFLYGKGAILPVFELLPVLLLFYNWEPSDNAFKRLEEITLS